MKARTLKQLVLYGYRFVFAYAVIFGFGLYFLAWRLGSTPPGLSQPELATAAQNASLNTLFSMPLYPLHSLLQWMSMQLFGVSAISLRMPSIIIAALTAILLYLLLRKWFGKPTALLGVALVLSADWFLFIARLATGSIEFSLWLTLALLSLMKLIERKTQWLLGFSIASVMLLFVPFGIYALITSLVCFFACKMFRSRAADASTVVKTGAIAIGLLGLGLFVFTSVKNVEFLKMLLGISDIPSPYDYAKNFVINTSGVVMLWPDNNPLLGPSGIFLIRFFEFIFMLFGLIMLWVTRVNRLNLVVISNAVVLAIAGGLSSGSRGGSLLIIPGAIFMTAGIRHFIHRWQRTFPKNPYAKVTLFVPLVLLVLSTTLVHFQSYFVLWPRQSATTQVFSRDFALLKKELSGEGVCAVYGASKETEVLLTTHKPGCSVSFNQAPLAAVGEYKIITANKGSLVSKHGEKPVRTLTSPNSEGSVRWLVSN